ncbi:MAG: ABC transporter substrate-binding protein [Thermomicrobiales bacterium]
MATSWTIAVMIGAITIVLGLLLTLVPAMALAEEAPATPIGENSVIRSLTREEYTAAYEDLMGFTPADTSGGNLIAGQIGDIQTLQPLLAEDANTVAIVGLIYQGLIGTDVQTGQPAPTGLADWWEIAPDRVTYTFHLNQDAKWHDGEDVTAEDVQFSFDALANPDVGSAYTQSFLGAVKSWRIVDADTFEVVATEPLSTFLYNLTNWIIPKHIWEGVPVANWRTDGGATGQDPARVIGSGPFRFETWAPGERVSVVRNDAFFAKVPTIDRFTMTVWPDQTAMVNALLNGEVDTAPLAPADVATVADTDGLRVISVPTTGFTFYLTNLDPAKTPLFTDVRVRRALLYGLDREAMARDILLGNAEVANGSQPQISYAYAPERMTTTYTYDPEKARALLAEAGWTDSDGDGVLDKDGVPFQFELIYRSGSATDDQQVAYMQDAWSKLGIAMTPRAMEFPALVAQLSDSHDFAMALIGFGWDASFNQDGMFGCAQYDGGFNVVRYCNEKVDALNAEAMRTFDEAARRELLIAATDLINEDLPVAVLHFTTTNIGASDRLQNFAPTSWGVDLGYVWIAD